MKEFQRVPNHVRVGRPGRRRPVVVVCKLSDNVVLTELSDEIALRIGEPRSSDDIRWFFVFEESLVEVARTSQRRDRSPDEICQISVFDPSWAPVAR